MLKSLPVPKGKTLTTMLEMSTLALINSSMTQMVVPSPPQAITYTFRLSAFKYARTGATLRHGHFSNLGHMHISRARIVHGADLDFYCLEVLQGSAMVYVIAKLDLFHLQVQKQWRLLAPAAAVYHKVEMHLPAMTRHYFVVRLDILFIIRSYCYSTYRPCCRFEA